MKKRSILWAAILIPVILIVSYLSFRSPVTSVSTEEPYASLMLQTLKTQRESFLIKNDPAFSIKAPYLLTEEQHIPEKARLIARLPAGTTLTFTDALWQRNSVSGVTHSLLTGKIWIGTLQQELPFEYNWGTFHSLCIDTPCNYWTFPAGIWQREADKKKYFLN